MRDLIKPTISLTVICLVVSVALGFTHSITGAAIDERARIDAENARKEVLADADKFEKLENIDGIINGRPELAPVKEVYKALKGDSVSGHVFTVSSKGYGGEIVITVGIDSNGKITGVKIGQNSETPGLGSKAAEEPFISQFFNITPKEPFKVVKGVKSKDEEINAISGATITSKAVVGAVQAAVDMAAEIAKEGGNLQ